MNNLNNAHKNGGWVLLQNLHLTIEWTSGALEKKVRVRSAQRHARMRAACTTRITGHAGLSPQLWHGAAHTLWAQ